jgi:two-component system OmpR family sensor kinase
LLRGLLNLNTESQHFSMRFRLTLWITLIVTLVLWVKSAIFWLYLEQSTSELELKTHTQMSSELATQVSVLLPDITAEELDTFRDQALRTIYFDSVYLDIYRVNGDPMIVGSPGLQLKGAPAFQRALESAGPVTILDPIVIDRINEEVQEVDVHYAQVMQVVGSDGLPYVMLFASSNRHASNQMSLARGVLQAALMISPLVGFVSGWFISGIAVAPIHRAQELIQKMSPQNMREQMTHQVQSSENDELAQEVEAARSRYREAFEAQERFLANVSHEIKTPIAVMLVESQTLNTEELPEDAADFVESVQDEMKRLGNLVESFLTLSRLEDGHDRTKGKRVWVNELALESVEHCFPMARQQGVHLHLTLLDGEDDIDTSVRGVSELLVTMLDNLIRNAIRFSKTGDQIDVRVERVSDSVKLSVRDHGPGIPEDRIDKIFDRFSQGGNDRKGRGHGLGLTIAQGIAEMHGGSISVENVSPGCLFCVKLPIM